MNDGSKELVTMSVEWDKLILWVSWSYSWTVCFSNKTNIFKQKTCLQTNAEQPDWNFAVL